MASGTLPYMHRGLRRFETIRNYTTNRPTIFQMSKTRFWSVFQRVRKKTGLINRSPLFLEFYQHSKFKSVRCSVIQWKFTGFQSIQHHWIFSVVLWWQPFSEFSLNLWDFHWFKFRVRWFKITSLLNQISTLNLTNLIHNLLTSPIS